MRHLVKWNTFQVFYHPYTLPLGRLIKTDHPTLSRRIPPSTTRLLPVTQREASLKRKTRALAMSPGLPNLHRAGRECHGQNAALQHFDKLRAQGPASCCPDRERLRLTGLGALARPTWGRGARLVRWALDVGLDPLVLSYQEERTGNPRPEAQAIRLTARWD